MTNKNKNQQINKNNLVEIVIGLGKKKDDLRIQGMQNIHPMYEALIALLRKQLKDDEIKDTIIDEKSLRTALVMDVFLEWVKPSYQSNLKSLLKSGKPLKEIVDQATLQIAEGKRMQDGNILYRADGQNPDKFFMKALKKANPYYLYIEGNELDRIKRNREKIKKIDKIKKIVIATLAGVAIVGSIYLFKNRHIIGDYLKAYYTGEELDKVNRSPQISSLETQINNLEKDYKEEQQEYYALENKTKISNNEYRNLNKRVLTPEQALDTERTLPHSKLWGISINKKIEESRTKLNQLEMGLNNFLS